MKIRYHASNDVLSVTSRAALMIVVIAVHFCLSTTGVAQEFAPDQYDPRIEIGLGGTASLMSSSADWSSDRYYGGRLKLAVKLFYGLSIEGGKGFSYGEDLSRESFVYGSHYILDGSKLPYSETTFAGLRYDIAAERIRPDGLFQIHSLLVGAGMVWDTCFLRSNSYWYYTNEFGWEQNEVAIEQKSSRKDKTADISGYYISLAARWRLDPKEVTPENWYGHYGIDAGFRYLLYNDSTRAKDTLMEVPGNLTAMQVYINLFVKMDLFY